MTSNIIPTKLKAALVSSYDLLSRVCAQDIFLMGASLESVIEANKIGDEDAISGDGIYWGLKWPKISDPDFDRALRLIKSDYPDAVVDEHKIEYITGGVPVKVTLVHKDYSFLEHKDFLFYNPVRTYEQAGESDSISIPNPVQAYFDHVQKKGEIL